MTPSQWLYDFLKSFEKFRPTAYKPTPKDKWTIGWGRTFPVVEGDTCTTDQAQAWLEEDVAGVAHTVNQLVTVPLTQGEFDALVSLVYNIGRGNFQESTLLRKLNDSDYGGAAAEFVRWDKQGGAVLNGLLTRREAEEKHFNGN